MPAYLQIVIDGQKRMFECGHSISIGRAATNDIVIPHPKISRFHTMVRMTEHGDYYLSDSGSANGTFVNGAKVDGQWKLSDGDNVMIGDHVLIFQIKDEAAEQQGSDPTKGSASTVCTMGGSLTRLTVLVSDIRGYTTMSERLGADCVAKIVAEWSATVTRIVKQHGGTIDKFIGDAVMARWTASSTEIDTQLVSALRTAHDFSVAAHQFENKCKDVQGAFRVGVGINTGMAMLGNIGDRGKREYTAVGDAVNLAFRLETASKELKKDVVIGPDCWSRMPEPIWRHRLNRIMVKGKTDSIEVCSFAFPELDGVIKEIHAMNCQRTQKLPEVQERQ